MKKLNTLKGVSVVILITSILVFYMQSGTNEDVTGSFTLGAKNGYELNLHIIANKLYISDKYKFAQKMIEKTVENNLGNILLSYDVRGYPNELHMSIFTNSLTEKMGKMAFEVTYKQKEGKIYEYTIKDNPEKFEIIIR